MVSLFLYRHNPQGNRGRQPKEAGALPQNGTTVAQMFAPFTIPSPHAVPVPAVLSRQGFAAQREVKQMCMEYHDHHQHHVLALPAFSPKNSCCPHQRIVVLCLSLSMAGGWGQRFLPFPRPLPFHVL